MTEEQEIKNLLKLGDECSFCSNFSKDCIDLKKFYNFNWTVFICKKCCKENKIMKTINKKLKKISNLLKYNPKPKLF